MCLILMHEIHLWIDSMTMDAIHNTTLRNVTQWNDRDAMRQPVTGARGAFDGLPTGARSCCFMNYMKSNSGIPCAVCMRRDECFVQEPQMQCDNRTEPTAIIALSQIQCDYRTGSEPTAIIALAHCDYGNTCWVVISLLLPPRRWGRFLLPTTWGSW